MNRISLAISISLLAFVGTASAQTEDEISARLTSAVHACESAAGNEGTFQQALCYRDEIGRQDQRLNELWKQVVARSSPKEREILRRSERQWIKDRDVDCHNDSAGYTNSTAAYMFNVCMARDTIRRIIWLENVRSPSKG